MSWEGVMFKISEAEFFLAEMHRDLKTAIDKPELRAYAAYMSSPETIVGNLWQPRFYYHLDAFLAATRSVPDIVRAWFGADPHLVSWLKGLQPAECTRRKNFQDQFQPLYTKFNGHVLSRARVVTVHRHGTPPVEVEVTGRWGVVHKGGPTQGIPGVDARPGATGNDPSEYIPVISASIIPLEPKSDDFWVKEPSGATHPLFQTCENYVQTAQTLIRDAQQIAQSVHGSQSPTPPPQP